MLTLVAYFAIFLAVSSALTWWRVQNYRKLGKRRF